MPDHESYLAQARMGLEHGNSPALSSLQEFANAMLAPRFTPETPFCVGEGIPSYLTIRNGPLFFSLFVMRGIILTNDPKIEPYFTSPADDRSLRMEELSYDWTHPHAEIYLRAKRLFYTAALMYDGPGKDELIDAIVAQRPHGWPKLERSTVIVDVVDCNKNADASLTPSELSVLTDLSPNKTYGILVHTTRNEKPHTLLVGSHMRSLELLSNSQLMFDIENSDEKFILIDFSPTKAIIDVYAETPFQVDNIFTFPSTYIATQAEVFPLTAKEAGFIESFVT